jgi:SNF2 family DNA or RNA helicase
LVTADVLPGEDQITVWLSYVETPLIREVPGSRYSGDPQRVWTVPLSWGSCIALRGVFGSGLQVGAALARWATQEKSRRIDPCMWLRIQTEIPEEWSKPIRWLEDDLQRPLFPFQRADAVWMYVAEQALLGSDMGTGKSTSSIMGVASLDAYPMLIVTPGAVRKSWANEFAKVAPNRTVSIVRGSATQRRKALEPGFDVYVINWEALRLHSRLAPFGSIALKDEEKVPKELNKLNFRSVVADEAHRAKDAKSKQTRALWAIGHGDTVEYRFALTGTPISESPADLWAVLHFLDPKQWPRKTQYIERYCLKETNRWGGLDILGLRPEHKAEFYAIFDPRFRRMPKDVVLPFLPEKVPQTRTIELPPKIRKAYDQMKKTMLAETGGGAVVVATNPMHQALRLMQFASATAEIETDDEGKQHVRLSEPSPKLDDFMSYLEDLPENEPVVVAAVSSQLIDMLCVRLEKAGISFGKITGDVGDHDRDMYIEQFQDGKLRVMAMTIAAGGTGITLTRSRILCRLQRSWRNLENLQVEDRIHRIGSEIHDSVLIVDFIAENTVEEGQLVALERKNDMLEEILRDGSWLEETSV